MLLCTYQEVDNSKHWQLQMLVSMWSNHSLLVGMQNGSVTLEDSLRIRFLIKWNILYCHFTCHNNHTLLVIYLKELTAYVHTEAAHRCSSSVQLLSCVWLFMTQWTVAGQASCPSPTPRAYLNSCLSSRWCHPTISSSVVPFSCLQSFPASGSFSMSQFFASGGQVLQF